MKMLYLIGLILMSHILLESLLLANYDDTNGAETGTETTTTTRTGLVPALYLFGDSLFDSGNNNLLPTLAKANYSPYGHNFPNGPTGRFTNGKTIGDFIAEYLGLPYPQPYVSGRLKPALDTGYNYASGSCGILPQTSSHIGFCLNLGRQISLFEKTVKTQISTKFHLSNSIFLFSVGSNDYLFAYFGFFSGITAKFYTPQQFADLLIGKLSLNLQKLYELGARKIVVFEIGPLGCIPAIAKKKDKEGEKCDEKKNEIVSIYNKKLALMLINLTSTLQDSHFILGQEYAISYDSIINPSKYGLSDSVNPCCETWGNGTSVCIPERKPCRNPNTHYFWDAFHPTEASISLVATRCINASSVCLPLNIHQLVHL